MKRTVNTLERMATQGGQVGEKARASLDDAKAAYESAKSLYADEKLARAAANEFVALSKSVESTSKGVAMIKLGRAATGLETALSGSKLGRGLMATGRITASQGFARGLVVAGAVLEGVVSYTDSPAQTVAGKVSNAALGAGGGALVMVNPVVAVGDLVAPKGYTLSEIYRGGATAISSIAEGFATGNTSAMDKFHRRSLNGDYGAVMQAASEAGEYWTEKGITGGLKEFAQSVQWWLSP